MNKRLTRKPLVEALVELRWQLARRGSYEAHDPAYPIFVGRLYDSVKNDYPALVKLPATEIPDQLTPYLAKYLFSITDAGWPVIQAGPGVATLNFTEDYDWDAFRLAALDFNRKLIAAYRLDGLTEGPQFESALLRYINALATDPSQDVLMFLADKLHTRITLPDRICRTSNLIQPSALINFSLAYQLNAPKALASLRFATGTHLGSPALILELIVRSTEAVPQNPEEFQEWLTAAHDTVEAWFFALISGELEAKFGPTYDTTVA
ncbi:MAG: TIGR04255 family protein [Acidobacteria bacterium]|nr:TIGR04255 family protein [Acidobacteriota bacterium]